MDKLWYIHMIEYNLPINKDVHKNNMDEFQDHYAEQKKLDTKEYIVYDSIYRKLLGEKKSKPQ